MKYFITSFTILLSSLALSQLQFDQIGSEPADCRQFNFQSGNGVVYASASGGTPSYTYQWTNLTTLQTSSNTTWGGLNAGDYEIKVWDSAGDSIVQIITLDSLNPIAAFDVISGPTAGTFPYYSGSTGIYTFDNQSSQFANPNDPNADTVCIWWFTQFENMHIVNDLSNQQYDYQYGGTWGVKLEVLNSNGCSDTAKAYITISGPASADEQLSEKFALISNQSTNQLLVQTPASGKSYLLNVYDLSGKIILNQHQIIPNHPIHFNQSGMFLFEIIDAENGRKMDSGKFRF